MDTATMDRPLTPEELNQHFAPPARERPVPPKQSSEAATFRLIGKFVADEIKKACGPLQEHIQALEKQLEKIEQRKYCGVWATGKYFEGQLCTFDGSMWHCNVDGTEQRPGTGPDWTLAIKRGQNGRDGKDGLDAGRRPTMARHG
jgi:hypothetical protein